MDPSSGSVTDAVQAQESHLSSKIRECDQVTPKALASSYPPSTYQQDPHKEKVSSGTPRGEESSEEEEEQVCQGLQTVYERPKAMGAADSRQPKDRPGAGKGQKQTAWGEKSHPHKELLGGPVFPAGWLWASVGQTQWR